MTDKMRYNGIRSRTILKELIKTYHENKLEMARWHSENVRQHVDYQNNCMEKEQEADRRVDGTMT